MKVIESKHEILGECATDINSTLKEIEFAGRTAYQSQDKITKDSAIRFCKMITKRGHHSVLEHSNIVIAQTGNLKPLDAFPGTTQLPFHMIKQTLNKRYVGGNIRAWIDFLCDNKKSKPIKIFQIIHKYLDLIIPNYNNQMEMYCEDKDSNYEIVTDHEEIPKDMKRVMVKFICPRGISHELVRHRVRIGITQESTRYVKYNNIGVIQPPGLTELQYISWAHGMRESERTYSELISSGCKPQIARSTLPIALKTEIVITADIEEWKWIFHMRCSPAAHPEMRALMIPLEKEFKNIGWI